jgi:hypothetical protein
MNGTKIIKCIDKFFPLIMICVICSTIAVYNFKKNQFISSSVNYTIALDDSIDEEKKKLLEIELKNLTFQDVEIEEKENITYIKVKCPPNRFPFFSKFVLNKGYENQ